MALPCPGQARVSDPIRVPASAANGPASKPAIKGQFGIADRHGYRAERYLRATRSEFVGRRGRLCARNLKMFDCDLRHIGAGDGMLWILFIRARNARWGGQDAPDDDGPMARGSRGETGLSDRASVAGAIHRTARPTALADDKAAFDGTTPDLRSVPGSRRGDAVGRVGGRTNDSDAPRDLARSGAVGSGFDNVIAAIASLNTMRNRRILLPAGELDARADHRREAETV